MKYLLVHCQQALANLKAAKLRSFLAALGILVGSGAIVALINCGQLATEKAIAEFKNLGTDLLAITVFPNDQRENHAYQEAELLTVEQWRRIPNYISSVLQIAPYSSAYQSLSMQGKILQGGIVGADESLAKILHINLLSGNFLSFTHSFERFCVIGAKIAGQLQQIGIFSPINRQLRVGNSLYTIIGVMAPWPENNFFNADLNQSVIVPIAGMAAISKTSKINNAVLRLNASSNVDRVIQQIRQLILYQNSNLHIFFRSAQQIINSMEQQGLIFTWLLAIIASISLLVGGIGIMNVMLVAVSERKKEIGIRKAVGAKNSDIQVLFLIESVILSFFGGILGITLGVLCTCIIAYFTGWQFAVYFSPVAIGFIVAVATGIFFGFYPARRAALMEPIVSLRSE